jgi:hypothetical protein
VLQGMERCLRRMEHHLQWEEQYMYELLHEAEWHCILNLKSNGKVTIFYMFHVKRKVCTFNTKNCMETTL